VPTATIWQRIETPRLSATELRQFAGTYVSPELDVTYTLVESASGLTIRLPGRPIIPSSRCRVTSSGMPSIWRISTPWPQP
jgi:hypothetical protein